MTQVVGVLCCECFYDNF